MSNRPFFVNRIPNSNLLLIVINKINDITIEASASESPMTTEPIEMETGIQYGVVHPCHKLYMNTLERRRLDECFVSCLNCFPFMLSTTHNVIFHHRSQTDHPDEEETAYCGSSTRIKFTLLLILLPMFYLVRFNLK